MQASLSDKDFSGFSMVACYLSFLTMVEKYIKNLEEGLSRRKDDSKDFFPEMGNSSASFPSFTLLFPFVPTAEGLSDIMKLYQCLPGTRASEV